MSIFSHFPFNSQGALTGVRLDVPGSVIDHANPDPAAWVTDPSDACPSLDDETGSQAGSLTLHHGPVSPPGPEPMAPAFASFGTTTQLASYLTDGFWQSRGETGHHWASQTISVNIVDLTPEEQALAVSALNAWHDVCNVSFVFTTSAADITYVNDNSRSAYCDARWAGEHMQWATVNISSDWSPNTDVYSYMYQTYLHETGHALGLGHQGPYNGSAAYGVDNVFTNDTWQYSVMSYFSQDNFAGSSYDFVITPQMADIAAVQSIYGVASTRTGNTVYGFNSTAGSLYDFQQYAGTPAFTIYDTGGIDTLDCSGYWVGQSIDLTPGNWSSIGGYVNNIGIFTTAVLENAVGGSGADTITGNRADNTFQGRGGDDTINGGEGDDSAIFVGARSGYTITRLAGNGVQVAGLDGADTLTNIERLVFDDQTLVLSDDDFADALGDTTAPFGNIPMGRSSTGVLEAAGDHDWFRISLTAGHTYRFDMEGSETGAGTISDPLMRLWTSNGSSLAVDDDGGIGLNARISEFIAPHTGTYYLSGESYPFAFNETGSYRIGVNDTTRRLVGDGNPNTLVGTPAANDLYGRGGNDTLRGLAGNDRLFGEAGNDRLDGGVGNDLLVGGLGADVLIGGAGADRFDFNFISESRRGVLRDTVTFHRLEDDRIDLSTIDADTDGTAGNQAFRFIGAHAFSGVDGQLRFSGGLLQGDTNGDRVADLEIRIVGALTGADMIL